jgi:hypothetical protein
MAENENERKNPIFNRRAAIGLGIVGAVVATTAAACDGSSSGTTETSNVTSANSLTDQQIALTVDAYNRVKDNPECQYPAKLLNTSLELQNQRKKLLTFNEPTKLGWVYLISMGTVLCEIPVIGKVSAVNSSMTANTAGYFNSAGTNGAAGVPVELPGDDLSFGPNEGGDGSVFFYTVDGGYINVTTDYIYSDIQLTILQAMAMKYTQGSKPTPSVAAAKVS